MDVSLGQEILFRSNQTPLRLQNLHCENFLCKYSKKESCNFYLGGKKEKRKSIVSSCLLIEHAFWLCMPFFRMSDRPWNENCASKNIRRYEVNFSRPICLCSVLKICTKRFNEIFFSSPKAVKYFSKTFSVDVANICFCLTLFLKATTLLTRQISKSEKMGRKQMLIHLIMLLF